MGRVFPGPRDGLSFLPPAFAGQYQPQLWGAHDQHRRLFFQAEAGERIRFSLASDLRAEELEIVLYDPAGNAVKRLDEAKALKTFAVLDTGGVCLLRAELCDLVGRFKAAVYRAP